MFQLTACRSARHLHAVTAPLLLAPSPYASLFTLLQLGGVGALRNLLVLLCAMAQLTYNLPPIDAAPALWQEVMDRLRWAAGC